MNDKITLYVVLLLLPLLSFAMPDDGQDYWVCKTHDETNREWIVKNNYQKIALNLSFNECKKQSKNPMSCKTSINDCEGFHLGLSTKPFWRCTALDVTATAWRSNYYSNREDAALAAQAYCKSMSTMPGTCYINLVTCINLNEG